MEIASPKCLNACNIPLALRAETNIRLGLGGWLEGLLGGRTAVNIAVVSRAVVKCFSFGEGLPDRSRRGLVIYVPVVKIRTITRFRSCIFLRALIVIGLARLRTRLSWLGLV